MDVPPVRTDRLQHDLSRLAQFGAAATGGLDRTTYSKSYRDAIDWITSEMKAAGMRVREDAAGNLIGRIGPEGPALICGSHVDTVPGGGAYDGALGVLAGLECARALKAIESRLKHGFEVIAFADEEGCYVSLLGSRAMCGLLSQPEIDAGRSRRGEALLPVMKQYGIDSNAVLDARRDRAEVAGYIELHVEQGPVLEQAGIPIGIVEGVAGISTSQHEIVGQANHAGTTPRTMRRDALRAAAIGIAHAYDHLAEGRYERAVLNFGRLQVEPGATNVVPRRVVVTQEVRSTRKDEMEALQDACAAIFAEAAASVGVKHTWQQGDIDPPAIMAEVPRSRIAAVCRQLNLESLVMPSGAGHDAQLFADICPTAMIFVPSCGGVSHNPKEYTEPRHIALGLQVLYGTCCDWLLG
jgi:hydantoinase/carbamoylase family amidase